MIIANPASGASRGPALKEQLLDLARRYGHELYFSKDPLDAQRTATEAARRKDPLIIAAGGDDTVRQVLRGIYAPESPLSFGSRSSFFGILPTGTFNNFAVQLGLTTNLELSMEAIHHGTETWVDLGLINGRIFTESIGVGIDVAAWKAFPPEPPTLMARMWSGALAVLKALRMYRPVRFRLEIYDQTFIMRAYSITVANIQLFSSAWMVAPHARIDDGKLDLCIIPAVSRARFVALLPLIFMGKHTSLVREIEYRQLTQVRISSNKPYLVRVDGGLGTRLPATVEVIPRAVPMRLPGRA